MARILVIDDEPGICRAFEKFLGGEGHIVRTSSRAETGLTLAEAFEPDLVILDIRLPGMSGLDALKLLNESSPELPVLVVTAYGTMETAVEAVKLGAYDYLVKPLELKRTAEVIVRALRSREAAGDVAIGDPWGRGAASTGGRTNTLIGKTPAMQEVFKRIGAVSISDVSVLVAGESGTGKEMVARAIHYSSARGDKPFEAVNCAAIPEEMLEKELAGTGDGSAGRIERAEGGTLFLDEVAGLPAGVQVRLLHLLEDGCFERMGETERVSADVRMIAATNSDLSAEVEAGRFREDLYYRLNVMTIKVPPLRDRVPDIPVLAAHFLSLRGGGSVSKGALRGLLAYAWPGNVRELRNAIEHAMVLSRGGTILPEHLPDHVREGAGRRPEEDEQLIRDLVARTLDEAGEDGNAHALMMERFESHLIALAMERTNGNQVKASALLGIHRTTLRSKLSKLRG